MQHGNHLKQMLIIAAVLLVGLLAYGVPTGSALLVAAVLACPIGMAAMMFFMMRKSQGQGVGHDHNMHNGHSPATQPACTSADPLG